LLEMATFDRRIAAANHSRETGSIATACYANIQADGEAGVNAGSVHSRVCRPWLGP
jgi:hypothetical protein